MPERHPDYPADQYTTLIAESYDVWILQRPALYIQCGFMCFVVYVFASTYCCVCTKAGGKENMGGVGIQGDVLHVPVVSAWQTKS